MYVCNNIITNKLMLGRDRELYIHMKATYYFQV